MIRVRLHAVEPEGVWVESQAFTEKMMDRCGVATSISTLLMFIPFARIDYVVDQSMLCPYQRKRWVFRGTTNKNAETKFKCHVHGGQ